MGIRVGIDTGGTFTDLIGVEEDTHEIVVAKRPSTPANPEQGVFDTLAGSGIDVDDIAFLILGSTMAVNTLHQRSGARVIYLTTKGFEDVPFIQRINRRHHYDLGWVKPAPFVERRDCLGVDERVTKGGKVLASLEDEELLRVRDAIEERIAEGGGVPAIAVGLLFAYANPDHELKIGDFLRREFPDVPVSLSHRVAPIWREYERGSTTLADAYIKPLVGGFARNLDAGFHERGLKPTWQLMKSNGGHMVASAAAEQPIQLLLSGLAGGIIAGRYFGELAGSDRLVTLDMGGTSTDVGIIMDGEYGYTTEYQVEWGVPVAAPFIDITTIGAGGGSIAWMDKGGFLRVGPQSAGADPGPACYDAGGTDATVTDANLVLGRLNPDYFLGGRMTLHTEKAVEAVARVGQMVGTGVQETALSIVKLANENMANAIRLITVERGIDPREFDLVAFGGQARSMERHWPNRSVFGGSSCRRMPGLPRPLGRWWPTCGWTGPGPTPIAPTIWKQPLLTNAFGPLQSPHRKLCATRGSQERRWSSGQSACDTWDRTTSRKCPFLPDPSPNRRFRTSSSAFIDSTRSSTATAYRGRPWS